MNKMKKTKLKLLLLALLGLILIPTTNAYELGNQNFWSDSWAPSPTTRHKGMCLHYSRDWYMTFDGKTSSYSSISSNNTSCSEWAILGNFFAPKDYSFPWNEWIYGNNFSYVNSKKNGEWMDMIRTVYENWVHKTIIYTLPSRTAYKRTSNAGIDYMFTQIYFYHNQFILYDPVKEFWLSFLGKMNIVWWAVFSNPSLTDDNLWFVDYIHKKAYSATITNTAAWKRLLWTDVSKERLQAVNWTKSYTINPWGSSFLPPRFKIDKQGGSGYQYIEDIEFTVPDWNAGNPNNQQTGQNQTLVEYNACFKYYNSIKIYTSYDYNCYKSLLDSAPLTGSYNMTQLLKPWQDIKDWNGEGNIAIQTQDLTCHSLIKLKREYKQQYQEKRAEFLKISSENFFYPHTMDIKAYCGDRPKDDENFSPSFLGSIWDFISGMFEKKGTWTGFNYSEKMEYYREKTLCTLFGWLDDKYCEVLNDVNTKNRYIKKDIDKGVDNSWWFSSFFSSIKLEFERGKKFFSKWVCFNPWITLEWDILVYLPMIALSLFFIWLLRNVK